MEIRTAVALAPYSTFHIGGPAEYFVEVRSVEELQDAIRFARIKAVPWQVIGGGSNILFADEGVRGLVIKNSIDDLALGTRPDGFFVHAGAGVMFDTVVDAVVSRGVWGFENLSAIPGTVGATPIQNVGAYGVEIASLISAVVAYDARHDRMVTLTPAECQFGYRHSLFKEPAGARYAICAVEFFMPQTLTPTLAYKDLARRFEGVDPDTLTPDIVRRAVIEIRAGKFPDWHHVGTAGSYFKNPIVSLETFDALRREYPDMPGHAHEGKVKLSLGWIIDHICGMRGACNGLVCAYAQQALVIVAERGATAREVIAFAETIASCVYARTHITIEWEVTYKK